MPPAVPIAAKIGIGLIGAKAARDSIRTQPTSSPSSDLQAELAARLFEQTDPIRQGLVDRSTAFLEGGLGSSPTYQGYRADLENQYTGARERIIGSLPKGGGLTSALAELEASRARDLTQGGAAINEAELGRALQLGTGTTFPALSSLGQSGSVEAMLAQADAARQASVLGALGTGVGAYLGSK